MPNLYARVIRGKNPEDFRTLTNEPGRKTIFLVGPFDMDHFRTLSTMEKLYKIGYSLRHIRELIAKGFQFKIVFFATDEKIPIATWENVLDLVIQEYPEAREKLMARLEDLKDTNFGEIERAAGYFFNDVSNLGPNDPRFTTLERLLAGEGTLVEVRSFLYHICNLRELYAGDGTTRLFNGEAGMWEYIMTDRPIADLAHLPEFQLIDVTL